MMSQSQLIQVENDNDSDFFQFVPSSSAEATLSSSSAMATATATATATTTTTTSTFEAEDNYTDDRQFLLSDEQDDGARGQSRGHMFSFAFYQSFFDVDTDVVKQRIVASLLPKPNHSFIDDVLRRKPDLWGPFWIALTLVVSMAVSGNIASYIQTSLDGQEPTFEWHYDFHKITLSATAVFSYAWLIPTGIYAFLWWSSSAGTLSFFELICLYGYSLSVYIPVSILWLIQVSSIQWILVLIGAGLSGGVIVFSLLPTFKSSIGNRSATILISILIILHLLLACGFMLYFFHVPTQSSHAQPLSNSTVAPVNNNNNNDKVFPKDPPKSADSEKKENDETKEKRTVDDKKKSNEDKDPNPDVEENNPNPDIEETNPNDDANPDKSEGEEGDSQKPRDQDGSLSEKEKEES